MQDRELYSVLCGDLNGKEIRKRGGICTRIADSLCCAVETNTRLPSNYIPTERLHFHFSPSCIGEGNGNPLQYSCLENPRDRGAWWAVVHRVSQSRTWLKRLSMHALEKEMATHSSILAWRIPGMEEPVGLLSVGLYRVGHDWSDLAAAAAAYLPSRLKCRNKFCCYSWQMVIKIVGVNKLKIVLDLSNSRNISSVDTSIGKPLHLLIFCVDGECCIKMWGLKQEKMYTFCSFPWSNVSYLLGS